MAEQKNKLQLKSDIDTNINTNGLKLITGEKLNVLLNNLNESLFNNLNIVQNLIESNEDKLVSQKAIKEAIQSVNLWEKNGNDIGYTMGKVGVGTLTPAVKLEVAGGLKIGNSDVTEAGTLRWTDTDLEVYKENQWLSLSTQSIWEKNGNDIGYAIGKVGIGTNAPTTSLEMSNGVFKISGTSAKNEDTSRFVIDTGASTGHSPLEFRNNDGVLFKVLGAAGHVGIGTATPSAKLEVDGSVLIGDSNTTTEGTIRWTGTDLEVRKNATWQSLTIQQQASIWSKNNQNIYYSVGNVGIATSSPGNTLDVAGGIDINDYIRHNGDINTYMGFSANDTIKFATNGVERVTITSAGHIGIGTDTPTNMLEVVGGLKLGNSDIIEAGTIRWTGEDLEVRKGDTWQSLTTQQGASVWSKNGNDAYYNIGNVGIGIDSPINTLDVAGSIGIDDYILYNGNTSTYMGFANNNKINFTINNQEKVSITSAGTVIQNELCIENPSNVRIHYGDSYGKFPNTKSFKPDSSGGLWIETNGASTSGIFMNENTMCLWSSGNTDILRVYDENNFNSPTFVIDNEGKVGMGTDDPIQNLHIKAVGNNADIRLERAGNNHWNIGGGDEFQISHVTDGIHNYNKIFRITTAGAVLINNTTLNVPDYVFEPDYKLESIEEHAAFMWHKKHLPALQSARAIKESEGYDITGRQEQLLEELEKAHIYIEQLNNKIKKIYDRLSILENAN